MYSIIIPRNQTRKKISSDLLLTS